MPQYLYECECGKLIEKTFTMEERKKKVKCKCGKIAKRAITSPNAIVHHRYIDNSARIGRGNGNHSGYFGTCKG